MDDDTLRVEQIRIDFASNDRMVELLARRHLAVLAVGLTTGASAFIAAAIGQAAPSAAALIALAAAAVVGSQIRALGQLALRLERGRMEAQAAIESLMSQGGETDVDDR